MCDKKQYVKLKILPKPWKLYTIDGCNACDILHVFRVLEKLFWNINHINVYKITFILAYR